MLFPFITSNDTFNIFLLFQAHCAVLNVSQIAPIRFFICGLQFVCKIAHIQLLSDPLFWIHTAAFTYRSSRTPQKPRSLRQLKKKKNSTEGNANGNLSHFVCRFLRSIFLIFVAKANSKWFNIMHKSGELRSKLWAIKRTGRARSGKDTAGGLPDRPRVIKFV